MTIFLAFSKQKKSYNENVHGVAKEALWPLPKLSCLNSCQKHSQSSIPWKGVSGREEKRVCMLYFSVFRRKICS